MNDRPITVVGAGPAGLACAIAVARAGRQVIVRERGPCVGSRFHGDFQGLENWTTTEDVLDDLSRNFIRPTFDYAASYGGVAFDDCGRGYEYSSSRPLFYLVRRGNIPGSLDTSLYEQALEAGVEIHFRDRVTQAEAPVAWSSGPRAADVIAVGYVFETNMPDGSWICFDNELAPRGYSYLLVSRGSGTLATCMFSRFAEHRACLGRTLDFFRKRVGLQMRRPRAFGGYGNIRLPRLALRAGQPMIGEHAGFQDPLAGFGIRLALTSGVIAAKSFVTGVDYERLWRQCLLDQIRAGFTNRFLVNLFGDVTWRYILRFRLRGVDVRDQMRRLYHFSAAKRLLFPLASLWQSYRLEEALTPDRVAELDPAQAA